MKRSKRIIIWLGIEYICLVLLDKMTIYLNFESWTENAIGVLFGITPLLILLYILKKDKSLAMKYKILVNILFWLLIICYIGGAIGKAIALNLI